MILFLVSIFLFPAFLSSTKNAQDVGLSELLEAVSNRIESYPELNSWEAMSVSKITRMDKNWQPEKVTVVKKIVRVKDKNREEEVLEAQESEKGVTKDIKEKYIQESRERRQKAKEREEKRKQKGQSDDEEEGMQLTMADLIPFKEEKRAHYEFVKLEDCMIEALPVYVLEARAKRKSPRYWEGRYYISKNNFDLLKIDLMPSKNPRLVKEMRMEIEFSVVEDHLVMKRTKMKVHGGMVVKNVRMVVEEDYSQHRIL